MPRMNLMIRKGKFVKEGTICPRNQMEAMKGEFSFQQLEMEHRNVFNASFAFEEAASGLGLVDCCPTCPGLGQAQKCPF